MTEHTDISPGARRLMLAVVRSLGALVERIEPQTARHLACTGHFSMALARRLGFGPASKRLIHLGAHLHDVGKLAVPPEWLRRPGRLSRHEFNLIKAHPGIGGRIVRETHLDPAVADLVAQHHERLDGSGYPEGLSNGTLMPEAMLVAVADELHALAAHRPYHGELDKQAIARVLEQDAADRLPRRYVDHAIDLLRSDRFAV